MAGCFCVIWQICSGDPSKRKSCLLRIVKGKENSYTKQNVRVLLRTSFSDTWRPWISCLIYFLLNKLLATTIVLERMKRNKISSIFSSDGAFWWESTAMSPMLLQNNIAAHIDWKASPHRLMGTESGFKPCPGFVRTL